MQQQKTPNRDKATSNGVKYQLPPLSYSYEALEPYIDARTMEIHHTKHHQSYIDKLNLVLEKYQTLADKELSELLKNLSSLPMDDADKKMLQNHGGGHINHSLFWQIMGPQKEMDAKLAADVVKEFGSVDDFKKIFTAAAVGHFGSGWTWLVRDGSGKFQVYSLPNQDSPHLKNHTPVIGLDLWEHAYYLKYQNRRAEYVENWWKVLKLL